MWELQSFRPNETALGDMDGDGDLDLVATTSNGSHPLSLFLNRDGDFGSAPVWSPADMDTIDAVVLGDIDNDGDLDLVCSDKNAGATVYLNRGGIPDPEAVWRGTVRARRIALGDVDGDGYLDLVIISWNAAALYLNRGALADQPPFDRTPDWTLALAYGTSSISLGDVDGDSDLDVVFGNSSSASTLYLNQGGTFGSLPAWTSPGTYLLRYARLGDIDADGDLDLVGIQMYYLNHGGGFEQEPAWVSSFALGTVYGIVLADVDGDGDLDILYGNVGQSNLLYENQGSYFAAGTSERCPVQDVFSMAAGDLDDNGTIDLALGTSSGPAVVLGDGMAGLRPQASWRTYGPPVPSVARSVALGDIDGDGQLDLACGYSLGSANQVFLNRHQQNPGLSSRTVPIPDLVVRCRNLELLLADVDRDLDLDLVCGVWDSTNTVHLNHGSGFAAAPSWTAARNDSTTSIALGDVDGDGDPDLVCGHYQRPNALYLNRGGTFDTAPAWTAATTEHTKSVTLGDVDGDGDPDLLSAGFIGYTGSCALYLNQGGVFDSSPAWISPFGSPFNTVTLGDVNADGYLDLFCGSDQYRSYLYLNRNGRLEDRPIQTPISWRVISSMLVDLDEDGDLDLVSGREADPIAVAENLSQPPFKWDPRHLTNRLPDTAAYVRAVHTTPVGPNQLTVSFRVFDLGVRSGVDSPGVSVRGRSDLVPGGNRSGEREAGPVCLVPRWRAASVHLGHQPGRLQPQRGAAAQGALAPRPGFRHRTSRHLRQQSWGRSCRASELALPAGGVSFPAVRAWETPPARCSSCGTAAPSHSPSRA